jgi:hypothetical protein
MYDLATLERLFAFDGHGEALPGDRIPLATVEVQPPVPYWRWVLSAIWLAAIFAGMLWPNLAGRIGPDCGSSPT